MTVFYLIFCFKLTHQLQTCCFFLVNTIQSHIFLFFTDIPHIFFHPLIFLFLPNNRIKFFMSMSINAWDTKVLMLLSLLLANIRILSCFFFLFLVMLSNFLIIPVVREKTKVKLAFSIPNGAPATLVNEMIDTPPVVSLKTIRILSM